MFSLILKEALKEKDEKLQKEYVRRIEGIMEVVKKDEDEGKEPVVDVLATMAGSMIGGCRYMRLMIDLKDYPKTHLEAFGVMREEEI